MKAGVPCSRYRSVAEAMADPQCAERGLFVEMGEGDAAFKVANVPYRMSATPTAARPIVAGLGEHTEEVLHEPARPRRRRARRRCANRACSGRRAHDRSAGGLDPATLPGTEERTMLRDSLRGFLEAHWPAADAVVRASSPTPSRRSGRRWSTRGRQPRQRSERRRPARDCGRDGGSSGAPPARRRCSARCSANLALADAATCVGVPRASGDAATRLRRQAMLQLLATMRRQPRPANCSTACMPAPVASAGASARFDPNADAGALTWRCGASASGTLALRRRCARGDPSRRRDSTCAGERARQGPAGGD